MSRRNTRFELTLFPFLSVLAGLIAVMMLFMIVITSNRVLVATETEDRQRRSSPPRQASELPDGIDAEDFVVLREELDRLRGTLAERRQQFEELRRKYQELSEFVEQRPDAKPDEKPRSGVVLGAPSPVDVIPARSGPVTTKRPIFVEVSAAGYVVHPREPVVSERTEYKVIVRDPKATDPKKAFDVLPEVTAFLSTVEKNSNKFYLVLLVHPSGSDALLAMVNYVGLKHPKIELGWEPFSREWILLSK